MRRILQVAQREFLSTVATKGFIIGVLVTPLMIGIVIFAMRFISNEAPKVEGQVAVIDPTGEVAKPLEEYLKPEAIAKRREGMRDKATEAMPDGVKAVAGEDAADKALTMILGEVPQIDTVEIPDTADIEAEKQPLRTGKRLALVVVDPDATHRTGGEQAFGSYRLFVKEKLDDRIEDEIRSGLRDVIVDARVRQAGLDRDEIETLTRVATSRSTTVTESGERKTNEAFNMLLPAAFMVLLLASVITGGQYILTTTVEEKSSRVVEVLLSAVSPMELMTGKILGQFCVGLVILALYAGMGITGLISFAMLGLLDLSLIVYLLIFYLIAYFTVASFMAAIGSAVNEMREAQTLMMPVMVTLMIPWLLWLPITRNPDSILAVTLTFIPPVNSFVTLLRLTSTSPPPLWQVWVSIAIGLASVYVAIWFAAKIFRVGLLMYGKPPNYATLIRWIRMA